MVAAMIPGLIDNLAVQEVFLVLAAVMLAYIGFTAWWAMRRDDAAGVRSVLKGGAIPVGVVGVIATAFGLWGELTWQYGFTFLVQYNILFDDVFLLFGLTLVVLAVSMGLSLRLQFAGLFALVAGGITISYAWNGYVLGLTKEPLDTFLLFSAFGLAGLLAFPATVMTDHYLAHPDGTAFALSTVSRRSVSIQSSSRAAQPIVPVATDGHPDESRAVHLPFRLPVWVTVSMLVFVVSLALAAFAALYYLDTTMPAHMATPP